MVAKNVKSCPKGVNEGGYNLGDAQKNDCYFPYHKFCPFVALLYTHNYSLKKDNLKCENVMIQNVINFQTWASQLQIDTTRI